jgi:hypothetical protein
MPVHVEPSRSIRPHRAALLIRVLLGAACLALVLLPLNARGVFAAPALQATVTATPVATATSSPTATPEPILDISNAQRLTCGGVYSGETFSNVNNVGSYGCRPYWDESGPEAVYRLELEASQPVTVTLLNASADLDLFLLRFAFPESCLAAGDNYLTYQGQPGVYFLSVDGYKGAAGSYFFRVDCPADPQATATPTFTPSPTPTATATGTPTATPSAGPPPARRDIYLPVVMRPVPSITGPTVTLTLQEGLNGYVGTTDTTLDSWEPQVAQGDDNRLRLFYSKPKLTTQMAPAIRFDLSLLPSAAQVQAATLRLYVPSTPLYDLRARVLGLLRPWDENTATWEVAAPGQPWSVPGAFGVGTDRTEWAGAWQRIAEGGRWYEFDVTPLAQQWALQRPGNFGMILESGAGDADASVEARFVSREGNANFRPQLIISYALPAQ